MRCLLMLWSAAGLLAGVLNGAVVSRGPWTGGVTADGAVIVAKLGAPGAAWLELGEDETFARVRRVEARPARPGDRPEVVRFDVGGLQPSTRYHYRIRHPATPAMDGDERSRGQFTTFSAPEAAASFRFAFSSCAQTGSTHPVFAQIRRQEPLFFLTIGDLHYEDIEWNHRDTFRAAYDSVLGSRTQRELYRHVPVVYTWDDHDFGPNGSDRLSPSREAAHATYREYVPHYPLPWDEERKVALNMSSEGPITQAFTVGRVRFLVLDTRSARDPVTQGDVPGKSMLGTWQKEWLKRELLAARERFPLIFIVSAVSWVAADARTDNWGRYTAERAELSDWMAAEGIRGVCFLSGDAHMLAADDGTHSGYARGGGRGFPALQAAPLDRGGSIKGGPWSVTPVTPRAGEGQFGLVEVSDRHNRIEVRFRGLNHLGEEKLRLDFSVPARSAP